VRPSPPPRIKGKRRRKEGFTDPPPPSPTLNTSHQMGTTWLLNGEVRRSTPPSGWFHHMIRSIQSNSIEINSLYIIITPYDIYMKESVLCYGAAYFFTWVYCMLMYCVEVLLVDDHTTSHHHPPYSTGVVGERARWYIQRGVRRKEREERRGSWAIPYGPILPPK